MAALWGRSREGDRIGLWVIGTRAERVVTVELGEVGSLTECIGRPASLLLEAVRANCDGFMVVRLCGGTAPGVLPSDRTRACRLAKAGDVLGMVMLDYLVVGGEVWSARRDGKQRKHETQNRF